MRTFALSEKSFNELLRLYGVYRREAGKCMKAGSYLAGCVMIGAAFETALVSMCHLYPRDIPPTFIPQRRGRPKPLLRWTLNELLRAARGTGWLPARLDLDEPWNRMKAHIGDYAVVLKDMRNLVHPARYLEDFAGSRVTKRRMGFCFEILELATEHLEARVHRSLRAALEKEERTRTKR